MDCLKPFINQIQREKFFSKSAQDTPVASSTRLTGPQDLFKPAFMSLNHMIPSLLKNQIQTIYISSQEMC